MRKKTILIAHNFAETSFSVMSHDLSFHLAKKGHRIIFISHQPYLKDETTIDCGQGEIILMSWSTSQRPSTLRDVRYFLDIYKKYKPNVVIAHFTASNICAVVSKIASLGTVKTFIYYHTLSSQMKMDSKRKKWKDFFFKQRKKAFYKIFCDYLICPSELAKEDLKTFFNVKNGIVVLNPMRDRNHKTDFINEISSPIIISYLGRLDPSKGVLELIEAFENYMLKNPQSSLILNLAGSGTESATIEEKIKLNRSIFFFGRLPYKDVDAYLAKSSFVIIPSKSDNLPTVGLEALMLGIPLLISDKTGLTTYLNESLDSFMFSPDRQSIERIFKKVECRLYDYSGMQLNARETYQRNFSMELYLQNMSEIIL